MDIKTPINIIETLLLNYVMYLILTNTYSENGEPFKYRTIVPSTWTSTIPLRWTKVSLCLTTPRNKDVIPFINNNIYAHLC
jgi:hypothetical protein